MWRKKINEEKNRYLKAIIQMDDDNVIELNVIFLLQRHFALNFSF